MATMTLEELVRQLRAVYGDRPLVEMERAAMGRPGDETVGLYWPDGVKRDRERAEKQINRHPSPDRRLLPRRARCAKPRRPWRCDPCDKAR